MSRDGEPFAHAHSKPHVAAFCTCPVEQERVVASLQTPIFSRFLEVN